MALASYRHPNTERGSESQTPVTPRDRILQDRGAAAYTEGVLRVSSGGLSCERTRRTKVKSRLLRASKEKGCCLVKKSAECCTQTVGSCRQDLPAASKKSAAARRPRLLLTDVKKSAKGCRRTTGLNEEEGSF